MASVLERLFAAKAQASAADEARESYAEVVNKARARMSERRGFQAALAAAGGRGIIAEIKHASPSLGKIVEHFDPAESALLYASAKVDAISVLTEASEFLGDLAYLDIVRAAAPQPILRKDFLARKYDIAQAAAYGADAILLIAAFLNDAQLRELLHEAQAYQLDVLCEVHNVAELERVLPLGFTCVGINNRDLRDFRVDLGVTETLAPMVPNDVMIVGESGIHTPADAERLRQAGAKALLIGESLMRSTDPGALVRSLRAAVVPATS